MTPDLDALRAKGRYKHFADVPPEVNAMVDDYNALLDALQAAREDAERYRWLRTRVEGVEFRDGGGLWRSDCPSHGLLDAAIDAARAKVDGA